MAKACEKITIVCGSTIFVTVRMKRQKGRSGKRAPKMNPTPEKMMEVNQRIAERNLAMILNNNFKKGDLHLILTYEEVVDEATAKKLLDRFVRKLRKICRQLGRELKAVIATEYEAKRIHHHLVVNFNDVEVIDALWTAGFVRNSVLDGSGDYTRLAHYIIKETSRTFRSPDAFSKRRYTCTRSIERPVAKIEEVSAVHLFDDPQALQGYFVVQDSVYRGSNPFDERPYLEYTLRSLDSENPRIARWRRGRKYIYNRKNYSRWLRANIPEQLSLFEPEQDAQASL